MTAIRPSKKSIEPITIIIVAANTIHPAIGRAWESLYAAVVAAISTSLGSLGDADTCRQAHSLLQIGRREDAEATARRRTARLARPPGACPCGRLLAGSPGHPGRRRSSASLRHPSRR